MPTYLVEVRAHFTATRIDPDAPELTVDGWELDDRFQDPENADRYFWRAEQDVTVETEGPGQAYGVAPDHSTEIVASAGWHIAEVTKATDHVILLRDDPEVTLPTP